MNTRADVRSLDQVRGVLFDLDNTLYPAERGVFDRINSRIERYVMEHTGLPSAKARALRRRYVEEYGTTLAGLMRHHGVDPEAYLDFVHQVPVESLLAPDPVAQRVLSAIRLPKVVFTNASERHARRVLAALGIEDLFAGICHLAATGYAGKPAATAYRSAVRLLDLPEGAVMFVDDRLENLDPAASLGMTTVFVGPADPGNGHHHVTGMEDLGRLVAGADWFVW